MAVTYGFYDSLNHDRLYKAQQMSAIFDGIINDGVFMSVGNQFHTVAGTGMQVIVKSGRAWFDSTWTLNDAEYPLSIDAADVLLTRIDAVVLEVNSEVATRANTIKVVKGTPASMPAKPTLTNTATVHQHALAYVTVAKNITAITNSMIEIVVGKTETPYVTAILQTTDITDLFNQWEDYFQNWFDNVRSTLDGDVALNLQNQITTLERSILKGDTKTSMGLPSTAVGDDAFKLLANRFNHYKYVKIEKSMSFTVPNNILNNKIRVICVGGGGGGGGCKSNSERDIGAGGGGGGYVIFDTIDVVPGEKLSCIIGAGGLGGVMHASSADAIHPSQPGGSSYIKRVSTSEKIIEASGGSPGQDIPSLSSDTRGGNGGDGGSGGGGGIAYAYTTYTYGGNGGNGALYGGGGGGAAFADRGHTSNLYGGNGGNGGMYGGGGGGGGISNSTVTSSEGGTGGNGGTYGGKGGNGQLMGSSDPLQFGDNGTRHLAYGLNLLFPDYVFGNTFTADGGVCKQYTSSSSPGCTGGTGGGGYGGNGGSSYNNNTYLYGGSGGGGYHANGGIMNNAGSGGGGFGGDGGSGLYGGGGGGGFFAKGGSGAYRNQSAKYEDRHGQSPGGGGGGGTVWNYANVLNGGNGGDGIIILMFYEGGSSDVFQYL